MRKKEKERENKKERERSREKGRSKRGSSFFPLGLRGVEFLVDVKQKDINPFSNRFLDEDFSVG